MKITVFTPAYNRAHTLPCLYHSLIKQPFSDFEWLIIDDGSSDNTEELIATYIKENIINIRYLKVKNGGKHRAINKATDIAGGEIFFIVDSDDYLLENALERVIYWFNTIEKCDGKFAGVCGLKGHSGTNVIGSSFEGEDSIIEAVILSKFGADGYKMRYFNEIIYICEYQEHGLSDRSVQLRRENIQGTLYAYSSLMKYTFPIHLKLRYLLNYIRFYLFNRFSLLFK